MESLRIIWMKYGLSLIHEGFTESPYRKVHCKFYRQARKGAKDKCRMLVNILINLVLLVFYHGVTAAIVTSRHHSY